VEAFPGNSASYLGKFVAGDTVRVRFRQDSGGSLGLLSNTDSTFFFGKRITDVSSEAPFGFGEASADNAGLVSSEDEFTQALDGDFLTGNVTGVKLGKRVTLQFDGSATHVSLNTATTATPIPVNFRPATNVFVPYRMDGAIIFRTTAALTGLLSAVYLDYAGSSVNRTDTSTTWTVTYLVP